MENVAVITHIADMDGIGSAAMVKMKFGMPSGNAFFAAHSATEMIEVERGMRKLYSKGILLFITDLALRKETAPFFERIIRKVHEGGGAVVLLDHHAWEDDMVERIARKCDFAAFGENREMCAAELTRSFIGLKGKFVGDFMDLVHHADFYVLFKDAKRQSIVDEWKLGIDYFNMGSSYGTKARNLRHVVEVISSGRLSDKRIKDAASRFEKLNAERIGKAMKDLYVVSGKIAVGFSRHVDSTDACMSAIRKAHTDIGIMVNLDHGKGGIRSVKSDVVGLARALGGGGHPHASGFSVDLKKYGYFKARKDKQAFADFVERAARKEGLI